MQNIKEEGYGVRNIVGRPFLEGKNDTGVGKPSACNDVPYPLRKVSLVTECRDVCRQILNKCKMCLKGYFEYICFEIWMLYHKQ